MLTKRIVTGAAVGYVIALVTSPLLPEVFSLLIPLGGMWVGASRDRKAANLPDVRPVEEVAQQAQPEPSAQGDNAARGNRVSQQEQVDPEFAPVLEYLELLEDMVISEGQKNNLDGEIVDKSLGLFARLQRVIPLLQELNNPNINHMIRRLVLKDLNGFITPFLRLSGETKTKNRRMLLNGLKDINAKITSIVETIEHKDLIELQTKADLIQSRYREDDYLS